MTTLLICIAWASRQSLQLPSLSSWWFRNYPDFLARRNVQPCATYGRILMIFFCEISRLSALRWLEPLKHTSLQFATFILYIESLLNGKGQGQSVKDDLPLELLMALEHANCSRIRTCATLFAWRSIYIETNKWIKMFRTLVWSSLARAMVIRTPAWEIKDAIFWSLDRLCLYKQILRHPGLFLSERSLLG